MRRLGVKGASPSTTGVSEDESGTEASEGSDDTGLQVGQNDGAADEMGKRKMATTRSTASARASATETWLPATTRTASINGSTGVASELTKNLWETGYALNAPSFHKVESKRRKMDLASYFDYFRRYHR